MKTAGTTASIEANVHLRIAYELVAEKGDLRRHVLLELVGKPRRYAELKPLLRGRRDHNLTVALMRLQRDGLIDRRTDARQRPVVHAYELTPLGVETVLAMHAIRPVHEGMEAYRKGRDLSLRA
jgi:DNA-binding HxlR family transcriptional regulator